MSPYPTLNGAVSHIEPRTLARGSDPITSHQAATRVGRFAPSRRQRILEALKRCGPMTIDEIAAQTGLNSQQVNKRLPEAQRLGDARPLDKTRKSASGHAERVWEAVSA